MLDNNNTATNTDAPTVDHMGRPVRVVRDCFLVVKGTAPRCRKVDTHIVKIGDRPVDVDPATVMPEARAHLAAFKNVQRAKLCLHYTEIGDVFRTVLIFDTRHVEINLL
jgi:hypothetical protein